MATYLVDEPKVILWIQQGELGGVATNISPDLIVTRCNTPQDFEAYSAGMHFKNSILDTIEPKLIA